MINWLIFSILEASFENLIQNESIGKSIGNQSCSCEVHLINPQNDWQLNDDRQLTKGAFFLLAQLVRYQKIDRCLSSWSPSHAWSTTYYLYDPPAPALLLVNSTPASLSLVI